MKESCPDLSVVDSLMTTLVECRPDRFEWQEMTLPTDNLGFTRRLCVRDRKYSTIYDPRDIEDMDKMGTRILGETDIAFIAKMGGLTWIESILNACVHWLTSREPTGGSREERR